MFAFANGSLYRDEWKDNRKHGRGLFHSFCGRVLEGLWVNNVFQGLHLKDIQTSYADIPVDLPDLEAVNSVISLRMILLNRIYDHYAQSTRIGH